MIVDIFGFDRTIDPSIYFDLSFALSFVVRHSTRRRMTAIWRMIMMRIVIDDDVVTVIGGRVFDIVFILGVLDERYVMVGLVVVVMMGCVMIGLEERIKQ